MYQYHGWLSLRLAYRRRDNGFWSATLQGSLSEPGDCSTRLTELLIAVGHWLPGSHGMLYEGDDRRSEFPGPNAFRVRTLARGVLSERPDPFFSPRIPLIEG